MAAIPWLGDCLQQLLDQLARNPAALREQIGQWVEQRADDLLKLLGGVGRNTAKLGFAMVTVLFLHRDGESLLRQLRQVLRRLVGARIEGYLGAVGPTTKAVVYGLVLTALAGLGYWVAGVHAPVLLAALTALVALIPFGTPFVWGSIGVWLLLNDQTAAGFGLLLWGTLVVSWVDNLVRPMVISGVSRVPFLLVMFGVLGGVAAFGLIGLFIGPVILAIMTAVWREWLCGEAALLRVEGVTDRKPSERTRLDAANTRPESLLQVAVSMRTGEAAPQASGRRTEPSTRKSPSVECFIHSVTPF